MGSVRPDGGPPDRRPWLLCDWGGTVMEDRPGSAGPMFQWTHLIALEGCKETLTLLTQHYRFALATNAAESDEAEIRLALKEVRLNAFFEHVFCARTLGVRKPSRAFFDIIATTLKRPAAELTMLGDDFEIDVEGSQCRWVFRGMVKSSKQPAPHGRSVHYDRRLERIASGLAGPADLRTNTFPSQNPICALRRSQLA